MNPLLESVKISPEQSFAVFTFQGSHFDCPFHYHPEIELTLIQQGHGTRIIGDHVTTFGPGDLCLIGPNLPHTYHTETHPGLAQPQISRSFVIQFRIEQLRVLNDLPEFRQVANLIERSKRGLHFPLPQRSKVHQLMIECGKLKPTDKLLRIFEIFTELTKIPDVVELSSLGLQFNQKEKSQALVDEICQYIFSHLDEPLNLETVAKKAQLSPSAFSRFFQRHTQQSFSQFLTNIRLRRACQLLIQTDLSVAEICYASGFGNLSNFNRRFKQHYDQSPKQWRDCKQH